MKAIATAAFLALVYVMAVGSATLLDWLVGLVVGLSMVPHVARINAEPWTWPRLFALPGFVLGVIAEIARGSWSILLVLLGRKTWRRLGIVRVSLEADTPRGLEVAGVVTTASPGAVVIDLDERKREMTVHVIDATEPTKVRSGISRFYERHQRPLLP